MRIWAVFKADFELPDGPIDYDLGVGWALESV
jgi:hypothetical protein